MENKPWYASRTIWGTIVSVLAVILTLTLHRNVSADTQASVADLLCNSVPPLVAFVGQAVAIYGRVKAETTIGPAKTAP